MRRVFGAVCLALGVGACGGDGKGGAITPPTPTVASVALARDTATLVPEATVQLEATPKDAAGNAMARLVAWASSDEAKARVSSTGVVTGVAPGVATITATSDGRSVQARIVVKDGAFVGSAGATLQAFGGAVRLAIPAGALTQNAMITIEGATSAPAEPRLVSGTAIEIGPAGIVLASPAELTLRYAAASLPAGPPERLLALHRASAPAWQELSASVVDPGAKTVRAPITASGTYAVLTAPFVASVALSRDTATVRVGSTFALAATPRDASGASLAGRDIAWASSDRSVATVDASGTVTAVAFEVATITATVEGKTAEARITVLAPVASVSLSETVAIVPVWLERQLSVTLADIRGNVLSGRTVTWKSSNAAVATVSAAGLVTGMAPGEAIITATSEGIDGVATVVVPMQGAVQIAAISPAVLTPGGTGTITGANFGRRPQDHALTIGGVAATVTATTQTTLSFSVPSTGFPCQGTQSVPVVLGRSGSAVASAAQPLSVARVRTLAPGQSMTLLAYEDIQCNELDLTGGLYYIGVANTGRSVGASTSFYLTGRPSTSPPPAAGEVLAASAASAAKDAPAVQRAAMQQVGPTVRAAAVLDHMAMLTEARELARRAGPPQSLFEAARARAAREGRGAISAASVPLTVGATTALRVRRDVTGAPACSQFDIVEARVVAVNSRAVVLEDAAAPLATRMDADYRALADEFEQVHFPLLVSHFGNPLAMDGVLDANGRILMLFTSRVNARGSGLLGFVSPCDFYPSTTYAASNEAELFYARVPTMLTGSSSDARDAWLRTMRSTMLHEVKHITSVAERLSRQSLPEEAWLEEATAQHAQELDVRRFSGVAWRGNARFSLTVLCDIDPTMIGCGGRPWVMLNHFSFLYDYLYSTETLSPLGSVSASDATLYGSAWALVRWVLDHYASSEADFLKRLTQEPRLSGLDNLEARAGRSFGEMLSEWSLALVLDDATGFTPVRAQLTFPSWHTPDIFGGMSRFLPWNYPFPSPVNPFIRSFGSFGVLVPTLRGGTAATIRLSGAQTARQLLELRSGGLGAPSTSLRLSIVRVQ